MCLIIHSEAGAELPELLLKSAFGGNPDGVGFMWHDKDQKLIRSYKTLPTTENEMLEAFKEMEPIIKEQDVGIHFRLRTNGDTDLLNAHPYVVTSKIEDDEKSRHIMLMHNGILTNIPEPDKKMSDTWHWIKYLLAPVLEANPEFVESHKFKEYVKDVGNRCRFLILDGETGAWTKVDSGGNNEKNIKTENDKKLWLSNDYSLRRSFTEGPSLSIVGGVLKKVEPIAKTCYYENDYDYTYGKPTNRNVKKDVASSTVFNARVSSNDVKRYTSNVNSFTINDDDVKAMRDSSIVFQNLPEAVVRQIILLEKLEVTLHKDTKPAKEKTKGSVTVFPPRNVTLDNLKKKDFDRYTAGDWSSALRKYPNLVMEYLNKINDDLITRVNMDHTCLFSTFMYVYNILMGFDDQPYVGSYDKIIPEENPMYAGYYASELGTAFKHEASSKYSETYGDVWTINAHKLAPTPWLKTVRQDGKIDVSDAEYQVCIAVDVSEAVANALIKRTNLKG